MSRRLSYFPARSQQTGTVLIIGAVVLMMLALIGIAALKTSGFEERMAGNIKDAHASFEGAEAAVKAAETIVKNRQEGSLAKGYYDTVESTYSVTAPSAPDPAIASNWTTSNANEVSTVTFTADNLTLVKNKPMYWIEKLEPVCSTPSAETDCNRDIEPFLVSVSSTGGSGTASVVLQAAYRRYANQ